MFIEKKPHVTHRWVTGPFVGGFLQADDRNVTWTTKILSGKLQKTQN